MMKQFLDFTDKVCLVTGAGSENGIGFQTAKILGSLGGTVFIVSTTDRILKRAEELRAEGADVKGLIADLMDRQAVQHLVKDIMDEYGRIDVLVNNAGMVDRQHFIGHGAGSEQSGGGIVFGCKSCDHRHE